VRDIKREKEKDNKKIILKPSVEELLEALRMSVF
jgi:hypothetical protein